VRAENRCARAIDGPSAIGHMPPSAAFHTPPAHVRAPFVPQMYGHITPGSMHDVPATGGIAGQPDFCGEQLHCALKSCDSHAHVVFPYPHTEPVPLQLELFWGEVGGQGLTGVAHDASTADVDHPIAVHVATGSHAGRGS
jgi:hypothetical protein